ncbi:MAG: hypothetical protein ACXVGG_15310 [Mycobacteriaceae bacterium]
MDAPRNIVDDLAVDGVIAQHTQGEAICPTAPVETSAAASLPGMVGAGTAGTGGTSDLVG